MRLGKAGGTRHRKERVVALLALIGCLSCRSKAAVRHDSADSATQAVVPGPDVRTAAISDAVFSAPIAAVRVGHTSFVAGLVAAGGLLRVVGMGEGPARWTADLAPGIAWAPDADIKLLAAGDGVAVSWKGFAGKSARMLAVLGPHGEARGEPIEIGAGVCTTIDGVAWFAPGRAGPARVRARRWSESESHDVVAVSSDRDPSLVCGDRTVFVLGDGDEDLTVSTFVPGEPARPPTILIRQADFGDDDEREHDTYTVGDDLAVVRIGAAGAVSMRELPRGRAPTAWRKLKRSLSQDDDVVAVDGDPHSTILVYTREAEGACAGVGSTAEGVRALRVDRESGDEAPLELAPPDCDRTLGPFWVASASGTPVVVWIERGTKAAPKAPPIRGLGVGRFRADGGGPSSISIAADALANEGCDETGCFLAALVRGPDGDVMRPGPIVVVNYP
jgi:hypothetical protein